MINRRYTILKKIGEGRSSVFLCHDKNFGKEVAIKVLNPSAGKNEIFAFKEEFLSLKKVTHPNILSVYDFGTVLKVENNDELYTPLIGSKYIISEYINGGNILEYCSKKGCADIDLLLTQICRTLYFMHQSNLIYFDLKYDNILVQSDNGTPVVKFIDFGFVQNTRKIAETTKKGTPQYIAPEILQEKEVDHRVDFYSLGIMLYRLFADKFPFDSENEIEIYKSHIENEIDFTGVSIPAKYVPIIKKLCQKDHDKRYSNALEIIEELGVEPDNEFLRRWEPVKSYVINNVVVDLKNFLLLNEPDFIKIVKGSTASGKTSLVEEIAYNFDGIVLISPQDFLENQPQWKSLLNKILFSEYVYQYIGNFLINRVLKVIQDEPRNIIDELKSIFINLSQRVKFTIIFDDFNKYDPITIQFLLQTFPILLVNKVRTIVIENQDFPSYSDSIASPIERNLDPFTEDQVHSLLHKTFKDDFPYALVTKLIYENCDLYPGAILAFIKDLIYSQAIRFTSKGVIADDLEINADLLKKNQFVFYEARLLEINESELEMLKFLSLFDINLSFPFLTGFFVEGSHDIAEIIKSLIDKKVLKEAVNREIQFTSYGFKNYVYNLIEDKVVEHYKIANNLKDRRINISNLELARQFELGLDFTSTYKILIDYIDGINKYEAYKYQLELLERLLIIQLSQKQIFEVEYRLSEVHYKLGNLKSAHVIIKKLLSGTIQEDAIREKLTLRMGECLVGLGSIGEGIEVFERLLLTISDHMMQKEIRYEIASALTYSNSITEAETELRNILDDNRIYPELRAKSLNLLGIIEAHYKNNIKQSIEYFTDALAIYEKEKMELKQAQVTKNIGTVYCMEGNTKDAEIFWKKSLNKNLEIGNLEEEATLLNNYGVLFFRYLDLEKSTENYKRALTIYRSLGRKFGEGLSYSNLGETYYYASEYDNALICLEKAKIYFEEIGDINELCEIMVLKGYLLKSINDNAGLIKLYDEFKELSQNFGFSQKDSLHFSLLEFLADNSEFDSAYSKLTKIRDDYSSLQEIGHYQKATILLCEYLLANKRVAQASDVIKSEKFRESISDIPYYQAYEKFLLGKISYDQNNVMKSNLEYYEEAYKILHSCSITELTWKTISALAEAYIDRGNINKAIEYIRLTKSLLDHISMNIKDIRLRSLYLSTPERKSTLEKLNIWENFIK